MTECPDKAELERYRAEAARLIREAETCLAEIDRNGAGAQELRAAAEIVAALKRLHGLMEAQGNGPVTRASAPPAPRRWWAFAR